MSDADLGRLFKEECERIDAAIIAAIKPPHPEKLSAEELIMHHHAAMRVMSELLADLITMISDVEMREALRAGAIGILMPDFDLPNSKELH